MSFRQSIRRQQLFHQAEGYLDLIVVLADRYTLPATIRDPIAHRVIESLDRLDSRAAKNSHALALRGRAFQAMGRYPEAVEQLSKATRRNADDWQNRVALGWCYKRTGRLDLAIRALEQALAIEPSQAIVHYNLACYWSLAERPAEAVKYLAHALKLDPAFGDKVAGEPDFDTVRDHPEFQALTSSLA